MVRIRPTPPVPPNAPELSHRLLTRPRGAEAGWARSAHARPRALPPAPRWSPLLNSARDQATPLKPDGGSGPRYAFTPRDRPHARHSRPRLPASVLGPVPVALAIVARGVVRLRGGEDWELGPNPSKNQKQSLTPRSHGGGCYAFAAAFFGLTLLMNLDLRWAPIEFGVLWAAVLTTIGFRMRRLGAKEA